MITLHSFSFSLPNAMIDINNYDLVRDDKKDTWLQTERGIGFQNIKKAIQGGNLIDIIDNKSINHSDQKLLIIAIGNYPYVIPCIIKERVIIMKTIFPCAKYKYLLS